MDWTDVKSKPKRKAPKKANDEDEGHYGGSYHGHLVAGAIHTKGSGKVSSGNQASAIADQDYLRDSDEEVKLETISHECALAVQTGRLAKDWSQAQLAKAVNEKTNTIIDIEAGHAQYSADTINRIEKALGVRIPRGRNNKRRAKKNPADGF